MEMERNISKKDGIVQQMASYNFDSRIKVSYIFEDYEEIDANTSETLLPHGNERNTSDETEILIIPSNEIYNSDATFNHSQQGFSNRPNIPVNANENVPPKSNAFNGHTIHSFTGNSDLMPNTCKSLQNKHINGVTYPANASRLNPKKTILNLLDTVSYNLISITKYYHQYYTDYVRTQGKTDARRWYLTNKHHYFNLSYTVSVSLFLCQENNQSFITEFITRTIELAHSNSWFEISFDNVKQLVSDMIQWTKQKKKNLEASTIRLRQLMHTPQPESNNVSNLDPSKRNNTEDLNSICLFSTGPPDKEVRITLDPTTLGNKSVDHSKASNTLKATKRSNNILYDEMIIKRKKSQAKNSYTNNQTISPTSTNTIPPPPYNSQNSQFFVMPNITHGNNLNRVSPGTEQNKHCENTEQPLILRSVSRDSGFGSPVLSLNDNTLYQNSVENAQSIAEEVPIPYGASTFISGPCKVCSSSTKKMCIGCYQEYYCTSKCQKTDWPVHMLNCRPPLHKNISPYQ